MKKFLLLSIALLSLGGCATLPTPQYTSPNTYQQYDCTQLNIEYNRVAQYISASASQHTGFSMSGIGIGIGVGRGGVYPTVNVGLGSVNGGNRNNLAIALGERDAIVQAARIKQCSFVSNLKLINEK
mgnify:CR=1 FL=1